jgi:hypothetical protein
VAAAATILTSRLASHGAQLGNPAARDGALSAFQDGFVLMAVFAFVGVLVALFISDRAAAKTMNPRAVTLGGEPGGARPEAA